jgi:hypothetical protein
MRIGFEAGLVDELLVGHVGEWGLSSGDLIEHKAHESRVYCMCLSGDKIATGDDRVVRVFNVSTCLSLLSEILRLHLNTLICNDRKVI